MALNFEEYTPNSKAEAELLKQKENTTKKKAISPEDKKKYIIYSLFAFCFLAVLIVAINDFSGDTEEKEVQEIGTPEAETNKYNSKIEAIEKGNKPKMISASLEDTYKKGNSDTQSEAELESTIEAKKLEEKLKELEREEEAGNNEIRTTRNNRKSKASYSSSSNATSFSSKKSEQPRRGNIVQKRVVPEEEEEENVEKVPPKNKGFKNSGFFGNEKIAQEETPSKKGTDKTIYACVHTDQKVQDGNRVKLRLTRGAIIDGNSYPINTVIYGMASIKPNRLKIAINTINQNPAKLEIYDAEDSNPGIYILTPNLNASLKKEVGKEIVDEKDLEKIPFSKTFKSFFQKKIKEEKVELLNNYKIIIKIKKDNESEL